ncbi:GFA family protein [Pseudomonas sp. R5(2019)]|uniref:GFA family protein n=1 Tax=Pseudomonas sp. R5(2019) TaxID=2697566 RepID=UPI0014126CD0|nr:GFA family protein [Pseudomonas sp. R5(2019)]NBA98520.1 GFA family protein [Pseudomonas sp. R5(2019)]
MSSHHEGGCHCGASRYRITGPLQDIAHCHCSICRRVSGAPVTTWITVPASRFEWLHGVAAQYRSSASCTRYFCSGCGAQLALVTTLSPDTVDVTIGTLDQPELAIPERHIWTTTRLPWLHLDEHLPSEPEETL